MERFNSSVDSAVDRLNLNNEYVSTALIIFFVVYASLAAPKLPNNVAKLFNTTWFRFFVFFAIAYIARQNASVAVIAALAVIVTLQTANKLSMNNDMKKMVKENEEESMIKYETPRQYHGKNNMQNTQISSNSNSLKVQQGPTTVQEDDTDYRNTFYPEYVEEPVDNMSREHGEDIQAYDTDDTIFASVEE